MILDDFLSFLGLFRKFLFDGMSYAVLSFHRPQHI